MRAVVADDEPDVRLLLELQLQIAGIEVVGVAGEGAALIELCREHEPDVAVVDLLMPGISGIEAIARLREEHPQIAIVANTAVAGEFVRKEMARLGVELMLKTGDLDALIAAVRRAVART